MKTGLPFKGVKLGVWLASLFATDKCTFTLHQSDQKSSCYEIAIPVEAKQGLGGKKKKAKAADLFKSCS